MAIDTQQVHSAMEAAGGDAVEAAKALNIAPIKLYNILHKTPELRARWTRSKENLNPVDQAAAAINRPVDPVPVNDVEALNAAAVNLRKGFEAVGLKGEALEQAVIIQQFARKNVRELMGFMAGSIAKQFADIEVEIDAINQRLAGKELVDGDWVPAKGIMTTETEAMLRKDRQGLYDLRIKSYDRATRAQVAMAMAQAKLNGGSKGKGGATAPGFGPLIKAGRKETPPPLEA